MLANKLAKSYVEKGFVSVSYEAKNVKRPKDLQRTRCQRVSHANLNILSETRFCRIRWG